MRGKVANFKESPKLYLRCMGETGVWVGGAEMDLGLTAAVAAGIS